MPRSVVAKPLLRSLPGRVASARVASASYSASRYPTSHGSTHGQFQVDLLDCGPARPQREERAAFRSVRASTAAYLSVERKRGLSRR